MANMQLAFIHTLDAVSVRASKDIPSRVGVTIAVYIAHTRLTTMYPIAWKIAAILR